MRFTLENKQILHNGRIVDEYASKGEAMAVFNILQAAFNEGYEIGLVEARNKLWEVHYKSNTKHNLRWILHVVLGLSVMIMLLTFATLPAGWLLIALVTAFTAGGSLYGLGRIDRVVLDI